MRPTIIVRIIQVVWFILISVFFGWLIHPICFFLPGLSVTGWYLFNYNVRAYERMEITKKWEEKDVVTNSTSK